MTAELRVAGRHRVGLVHRILGMTAVPLWWFDGSDLDAVAFGVADNRTHTFSWFDEPALAKLLEQLKKEDSLEGVGSGTHRVGRADPPQAGARRNRAAGASGSEVT